MLRHLAAAILLVLLASGFVHAQTKTVLVFPFENETNDRNLDWIGEGIAELTIERLQSDPGLYVFSRDERLAGFDTMGIPEGATVSRATAMNLGWNLGSDAVITGRFSGTADKFTINARVIDLTTSTSGHEIPVEGKLEDVIPLTGTLSLQVLRTLDPATTVPETDFTTHSPVPRSAFENYIRGILVQDPQQRSEYFEKAIRLHPQYQEALFQLGHLQHTERDFKNSDLHLDRIPNSSIDYRQAQFMIGLNQYRLEDFAHAVNVFTSLPQNYAVSMDLGAALLAKGDTTGATAAWKRAMESDPMAADAPFNLGYLSFTKGDNDTAIRMLELSLKLQGRDAEAMFLLARSYERTGRTEEAQKTMAQATRLSVRVERWQTQLPTRLERLIDLQNPFPFRAPDYFRLWTADRLARRAKGRDVNDWLDAIQTQIDSELYGDATRELQTLMAVYPQSADAHLLLAQVCDGQKNDEGAITEIEHALGIKRTVESYMMLARTYRTLNQPTNALDAVNQALEIEPEHAPAIALKTEIQRQIRLARRPRPGP